MDIMADRLKSVSKSFIREILKVAADPNVISFAGGLPNPDLFPVKEIEKACSNVLREDGANCLQYSTTEGYKPLREYISKMYKKNEGFDIDPDEILITNGSQQGLDLIGKVFINEGDDIIIEKPGYLGAIQAFSVYRPKFNSIDLLKDGIDIDNLEKVLNEKQAKLFYGVFNFQNPSGITYSREKREKIADIFKNKETIIVEDNPYGELRFLGERIPSMKKFHKDTILLGTFSKIVVPSFRLGWIVAKKEFMESLIIVKQAADLHTNYFTQRVLYRYLIDNDLNEHIEKIKDVYGKQREKMLKLIKEHFPKEITYTEPEGGMFLWVYLPERLSAMDLFNESIKENIAFVPGDPFFIENENISSFRLNYSNVNEEKIEKGIKKLAIIIQKML